MMGSLKFPTNLLIIIFEFVGTSNDDGRKKNIYAYGVKVLFIRWKFRCEYILILNSYGEDL